MIERSSLEALPARNNSSTSSILRSGSGIILLATSVFTYGSFWRIEQDDDSDQLNITIGLLEQEQPEVENYGLSPGARSVVVATALQDLATQNNWCSNVYLQVDSSDIPSGISSGGGVTELPIGRYSSNEQIDEVRVCADENSFVVEDDKVIVYLKTEPYIPQVNNAPSIAETFSNNIEICRDAKRQIVELAQSDLNQLELLDLGDLVVLVDERVLDHPCD